MSMTDIPFQERAQRMLMSALRQGRTAHAYVFAGPAGTGRKRMALAFAKALLCERRQDDACGECVSCRKAESGNHERITVVAPDGASIKIDQIRELQKQFSYRSQGNANIYIMEQADKMTTQAANSLLKFLEEPSSGVVAILLTENGQAMLPTIRSRAQWVPFAPLSAPYMEQTLQGEGHPLPLIRAAVRMSSGLEQARELIQYQAFAETRNVVIQLMKETLSGSGGELVTVHTKLVSSEAGDRSLQALELASLLFKDFILIQNGKKESVVYIDQLNWLSKQAFTRSVEEWVRCMELAFEAKKRIRFHAGPQLVLEQFVISVQGGTYAIL